METFSESNISIFKLFHLNCCRIFPQIATVADIDTADWLRLRPEIFKCKKLKDRKSTLLWPNQPDLQTSKKQTGNQLKPNEDQDIGCTIPSPMSRKMDRSTSTNVEIFLLSIYKTTLAANQNNMATPQTYDSQQMAHMLSLPQPCFKII